MTDCACVLRSFSGLEPVYSEQHSWWQVSHCKTHAVLLVGVSRVFACLFWNGRLAVDSRWFGVSLEDLLHMFERMTVQLGEPLELDVQ